MKIFGDTTSGNCLKIKYVADHLRVPYEWITVSALSGETRSPEFLKRNPMGQIPVVELSDGRHLAQSNAIIRYLARGSDLLPDDPFTQAKIDEWLFWEQYSHEPYVAVCRFHMLYQGRSKEAREPWRVERGEKALDLMEMHLSGMTGADGRQTHGSRSTSPARPFLVGETLSIADVALVAYTRVAHEGGFDLTARPHVKKWVEQCEKALQI